MNVHFERCFSAIDIPPHRSQTKTGVFLGAVSISSQSLILIFQLIV